MINIFRDTSIFSIIFLILITIVLRGSVFFFPEIHPAHFSAPIGADIFSWLDGLPDYVLTTGILSIVLIVLQALYMNQMVINHTVLYKNSYLPGLFYVVICSIYPSLSYLSPQLLANTFVLLMVSKLFSLYNTERALESIIDAGLLLGIAILINFESILLLPIIPLAVLTIRPFKINELILSIVGILIPVYLIGVIYFVFDNYDHYHTMILQNFITTHLNTIELDFRLLIPLMVVLPLLLISLIQLQANFFRNNVKTRKVQQITFFILLVSVLTLFIGKPTFIYSITYMALPVSILLGYYFLGSARPMLKEILFLLLLCAVIYLQYFRNFIYEI